MQEYLRTTWINDTEPAINSTNLNNIELGIERATAAIQSLEANPSYVLPPANDTTLGGVKIKVEEVNDGEGNITQVGEIWVT